MRTLQANLAVFFDALPKLLPDHQGEYALICQGQASVYSTAGAATQAGLSECGNAHEFLVLKIEPLPSDSEMQRLGKISIRRNE